MNRLPVIVALGGFNAAGRVSGHHAYRRLVIDRLPREAALDTYRSLASLMQLEGAEGDVGDEAVQAYIRDHTLIRRIEAWDTESVYCQRRVSLKGVQGGGMSFEIARRHLPEEVPGHWHVTAVNDSRVRVDVAGELDALLPDIRQSQVRAAGQLPSGFEPGARYPSRNHPRGLQLTVCGASDAIQSMGIPIDVLKARVPPDQFSVYASSAMSQLDADSYGGLFQNPMIGKRPTSKHIALSLPEMPADFINAYVLGSVGSTAGIIGACATYLYNLRQGIEDIRAGRARVVIAGNAEAPVVADVIEGYRTMGALATDEGLMQLDGTDSADHRRACRPFGENCGFTVAEGGVFSVIMDDELALELGADVLGSVASVHVHADGFKKSIPGPGVGNYLTFAKSLASARAILGEEALARTYVQAHGTGTPQNRVTESHILNELARAFGIDAWPVSAIKAFVGHTMAPAGAEQLAAILGAWQHGWIPGITTIDAIADDVHDSHLDFLLAHREFEPADMDAAFINSKGFGGNNATGCILSPQVTERMLAKRWGAARMKTYYQRREQVRQASADHDARATRGETETIYRFGEGVLGGEDLSITRAAITVPGFAEPVNLELENPYLDMT